MLPFSGLAALAIWRGGPAEATPSTSVPIALSEFEPGGHATDDDPPVDDSPFIDRLRPRGQGGGVAHAARSQ